jgi:hypothetical protein
VSDDPRPDEPELYLVDLSNLPGAAERREQLERARAESRRRYHRHLAAELDANGVPDDIDALADLVLDALTVWRDVEDGRDCQCSCHPRLPADDLHDFGFSCPCSKPAEERRRGWDDWYASLEAYWASPAGRREAARRDAEDAELAAAIDAEPGIVITSHGGMAPEQWRGSVDGHTFYFRERHDLWRIELDLRPSGQFVQVWAGGDPGEESNMRVREIDVGDVIARGDTGVEGYGTTPTERLAFIADTIRTHLALRCCEVHAVVREDLELLLGRPLRWCPACGLRQ